MEILISWIFNKVMGTVDKPKDDPNFKRISDQMMIISKRVESMDNKIDEMLYYSRCDLLGLDDDRKLILKRFYHNNSKISFITKSLLMNEKSYKEIISGKDFNPISLYVENCWKDDVIFGLVGSPSVDYLILGSFVYIFNESMSSGFSAEEMKIIKKEEAPMYLGTACKFIGRKAGSVSVQGLGYKIDEVDPSLFSKRTKMKMIESFLSSPTDNVEFQFTYPCNKSKWGKEFISQILVSCKTCKFKSSECVCYNCGLRDHRGHDKVLRFGRGFCDFTGQVQNIRNMSVFGSLKTYERTDLLDK